MFRFWNQIIAPLLAALSPKEILLIGGGTGRTARTLAEYARTSGGKLTIIDPLPLFNVASFSRAWQNVVTFYRTWSADVLPACAPPDVVLIDGDHNWYTVYHELLTIEALAKKSGKFPVILLHDVAWPYARRDSYMLPSRIPPEFRQPCVEGGVVPESDHLIVNGGLNERMFHATKNGGPKNGVLTALEDFISQTTHRLTVTFVEGFHGLAIITPEDTVNDYPMLRELLSSFTLPAAVCAHLRVLEEERMQDVLTAKELRFSMQTLRVQRDAYREAMTALSTANHQKDQEIVRRENTLSWRITSPLRRFGSLKKAITKNRTWCGLLKHWWTALGQPCPGFVRWVRHRVVGGMRIAPDSLQQKQMKRANDLQNRYGGAVPVSVIVTARNNGEFLRECLESILQQTVKPMDIIYCDDGSEDRSVAIASSMPGIRVLSLQHQGVAAARNAAVKESKGDLLMHVDGDDILPPEYLAEQLLALANANGAAFAFGGTRMFGLQEATVAFPWDIKALWTRNFINTSSLVRRSAFEAVGGWRDIAGTLWDWDLWLRISRIGPGVAADTFLHYRRHESSWSQIEKKFSEEDVGLLFGRIRRAVANVSVCAIVSGRLPELMDTWIDALVASIKASDSAVNSPELVILDNSNDGMEQRIKKALEKHDGVFRSVMVVPYPVRFTWTSEMERRHMVSTFLATAYNRVFAMADGEIVWFLEDDIVVPECAYETLLRDLTDGDVPPAAATGLYRARHMDQLVAHHVINGDPIPVEDRHSSPLDIDLGGTGCMMAFRPFITHPFTSHWRGSSPAHDWAWCDEIRKDGHRIILDPRVRCRHYQTLTEFV